MTGADRWVVLTPPATSLMPLPPHHIDPAIIASPQPTLLPQAKQELSEKFGASVTQLESYKAIFVQYTTKHRGIDQESFKEMLSLIYGIHRHPFAPALFAWMDTKGDGLIDFYEFVEGMATINLGDSQAKCRALFWMLDRQGKGSLSLPDLNRIFDLAFVDILDGLKKAHSYFSLLKTNKDKVTTKDLLNNRELMDTLETCIDIIMDRNTHLKTLVYTLQALHSFDMDKLLKLWELYRGYFQRHGVSDKRPTLGEVEEMLMQNLYRSEEYKNEVEPSSVEMTGGQLKVLMRELFKVRDVGVVEGIFKIIGKGEMVCPLDRLFEGIGLYLDCPFELKITLLLEIYSVLGGEDGVHDRMIGLIDRLNSEYWAEFNRAKGMIEEIMDGNNSRFLTANLLEQAILSDPKRLDWIFRFTLGDGEKGQMEGERKSFSTKQKSSITRGNEPSKALGYKNWGSK